MRQEVLFRTEQSASPGFSLVENYVTPDEEREWLAHVDAEPWETDWRRRIQQFGLGYVSIHGGKLALVLNFPEWLRQLARRVARDATFERWPENCG